MKESRLPNTGSESTGSATVGVGSLIAAVVLAIRKRQKQCGEEL